MLTHLFPSTDYGAELYGGFMLHEHCFCKEFDKCETIDESVKEINIFLNNNGYNTVKLNEFDETLTYKSEPVTISPHGYKEQLILYINRDVSSVTQTNFLTNLLKKFRDARDWEQFHNSKDLAIALNIETSELLELFLWKKHQEADIEKLKEELADVFAYAFLLAAKYDLNVEEIVLNKIKLNSAKYPVEKAKGTAKKYDEL